jgi:hypothetical protein
MGTSNNLQFVTPAEAGAQSCQRLMDSCLRRNDMFGGCIKNVQSFAIKIFSIPLAFGFNFRR